MKCIPKAIIISENGDDANWLGTCRCLGEHNIPVIRLSPYPWYDSKYCQTIISPKIYAEPEKYLKFLFKISKKNQNVLKPVLFPTSDNSLILVSRHLDELSKYYNAVACDWSITKKIVDKSLTYSFAKSIGVPIPETYEPEDFKDAIRISKEIEFPCLLKPTYTHQFYPQFKNKLFKTYSKNELLKKYLYLTKKGHRMIIQEEVIGPDENNYMLDTCLNTESKPLAFITSRKIRQNPPHFGVGSFVKSTWEPLVAKLGFRLLKKLGFYGIANIDFKLDAKDNILKLLEINGRSHTQISLSKKCGQNLPYTLYKDITGNRQQHVDVTKCNFKTNERWVHLMIDILSMLEKRKNKEITLGEWLLSLKGTNTCGIFSIHDPIPFLSELKRIFFTLTSRSK